MHRHSCTSFDSWRRLQLFGSEWMSDVLHELRQTVPAAPPAKECAEQSRRHRRSDGWCASNNGGGGDGGDELSCCRPCGGGGGGGFGVGDGDECSCCRTCPLLRRWRQLQHRAHTHSCMCFDKQQLRWQALDQSVEPCCAARASTGSGGGAVGGKGGSLRVDRRAVVTVSLCGCRRRPPLLSACSLTSMAAAGSTCTDTAARASTAASFSDSCLDQSVQR